VIIGSGLAYAVAPDDAIALGLDPTIQWFNTQDASHVVEPPDYASASYFFLTASGSGQDLSHPYQPGTAGGAAPLSMKHHGDSTGDYKVDVEDLLQIMQKIGAQGEDAGG